MAALAGAQGADPVRSSSEVRSTAADEGSVAEDPAVEAEAHHAWEAVAPPYAGGPSVEVPCRVAESLPSAGARYADLESGLLTEILVEIFAIVCRLGLYNQNRLTGLLINLVNTTKTCIEHTSFV